MKIPEGRPTPMSTRLPSTQTAQTPHTTPAATTRAQTTTSTQATTSTGAATFEKVAASFARSAEGGGLQALDALWNKGQYGKILDVIRAEIAPLLQGDFKGVDGNALIGLAKTAFVYEERTKAVLNKLSMADDGKTKLGGLQLAQDLAQVSTKIFRRAVELQDAADPAPVLAWQVAKDTHKKAHKWSPDEHLNYVAQKTVEFYLKGGQESQIRHVDADFLKGLKSGQLCEYVVDMYDVARAAVVEPGKASPGHTVLAQGNDAYTAGTFEVQKDARGDVTQVLIGTFSGHFRTGYEAQDHLVRHAAAALSQLYPHKSPTEIASMIVRREGQATNPRTIEVIARGIGMDGAEAQRLESEAKAEAMRWQPFDGGDVKGAGATDKKSAPDPLHKSVGELKDAVVGALKDGAFSTTGKAGNGKDALAVLQRIDDVMARAADANNVVVGDQLLGTVRALLDYTGKLSSGAVHPEAKKQLEYLHARWNNGVFGTTGADLGLVFSQKPVADRSARVVATVNPKGVTDAQLRDMIAAGMDVARFNTAHGTLQQQVDVMKRIRSLAAEAGREVTIQIDLEGPKMRLGTFANPNKLEKNDIFLKKGTTVTLTSKDVPGNATLFPVDYPTMCNDVKPGDPFSMNDGTVKLKVISVDAKAGTMQAEVLTDGKVWDRKGVSFPTAKMSGRTVTDEDLQNLTALLPHVDLVAQSFVQDASDIVFLRERMRDLGREVPIIAKIERRTAVDEENLRQIALVSDALMVARGDLGVEIDHVDVPEVERRVREIGETTGRPVMLATEVLMSMLGDSRPTRAEVDALYGAVKDRKFHAIMLGKEASAHANPGDVVREASRIIEQAEAAPPKKPAQQPLPARTAAQLFMGNR